MRLPRRARIEGVAPAHRRRREAIGAYLQLVAGLALFGFSVGMLVRSDLGLDPWDVFHQGVSRRAGISIGAVTILTGIVVLLGWVPLRQRPGIGTLSNVVLIGVAMDVSLLILPELETLAMRWVFLVSGIILYGIATGAYIGARLGAGPRDGLMVGIAARGHSIRVVRTGIELTVLLTGYLLGGTVGIGTLLFAVSIGPIVHVTIPAFTRRAREPGPR